MTLPSSFPFVTRKDNPNETLLSFIYEEIRQCMVSLLGHYVKFLFNPPISIIIIIKNNSLEHAQGQRCTKTGCCGMVWLGVMFLIFQIFQSRIDTCWTYFWIYSYSIHLTLNFLLNQVSTELKPEREMPIVSFSPISLLLFARLSASTVAFLVMTWALYSKSSFLSHFHFR